MRGAGDENGGRLEDGVADVGFGRVLAGNHHIQFARLQKRQQPGARCDLGVNPETRMALDDFLHQRLQERHHDRRRAADPHDPGLAAGQQGGVARQIAGLGDHRIGPIDDELADGRERRSLRRAVEDLELQLVLEPGDALGEVRLGHAEGLGGLGEAAVLRTAITC
jgi:hypothetical protein